MTKYFCCLQQNTAITRGLPADKFVATAPLHIWWYSWIHSPCVVTTTVVCSAVTVGAVVGLVQSWPACRCCCCGGGGESLRAQSQERACFPLNMLGSTEYMSLGHTVISDSCATANQRKIIIYFARARSYNAIYPRKLYTTRIKKSWRSFYAISIQNCFMNKAQLHPQL